MMWTRRRAAGLTGAVLAATSLAGCENMGADGVEAELDSLLMLLQSRRDENR